MVHKFMGIHEKKERERERKRRQILVAARRIFSSKGFAGTTMEDIAREAEFSTGTLYLFFKNKDELFSSLSLRILQYLKIRLEQAALMTEGLEAGQKIALLKEALWDVYQFDHSMLINMFHLRSGESLKHLPPELLQDIRELSQASIRIIAGMIDEEIKAGRVIGLDSTDIADIIWSVFMGVILWEGTKSVVTERQADLPAMMNKAFKIICQGIFINEE